MMSQLSATEEEVCGEGDVPVVSSESLFANIGFEAHLHQLVDLVLLGDFLREVLSPGLGCIFKHLFVVFVHASDFCILGIIYKFVVKFVLY
jgi:hypothetical protein